MDLAERLLILDPKKKYFNASRFDGLRLKVKGNGKEYAVHLRTSSTILPRQYYQAKFETDGSWQEVLIPFKYFKPNSLKRSAQFCIYNRHPGA